MERNNFVLIVLFSIFIFIVGFSVGVRTTGLFGLEEQEPLIEKQGFCWTSTEHLAVPYVEPQDKVLTITDINE